MASLASFSWLSFPRDVMSLTASVDLCNVPVCDQDYSGCDISKEPCCFGGSWQAAARLPAIHLAFTSQVVGRSLRHATEV